MVAMAANGADWARQGGKMGKWGMVVQAWRPGGCKWRKRWRAEVGASFAVGAGSR